MTRLFRFPSLCLLCALSLAYAWAARDGNTFSGVVLTTVTSLPLICVVWLGWWLISGVLAIPDSTSVPRLLRHGSRTRALVFDAGRSLLTLTAAAMVTLAGSAIAGIGLPETSKAPDSSLATQAYANAGVPAGVAVLAQLAWLGLALCIVRAVMVTLYLLMPKLTTLVVFGLLIWVWGALAIAGTVDLPPVLQPSTYFDAATSVGNAGNLTLALVMGTLLVASCLVATRVLDSPAQRFAPPLPWLIYALAVVVSVAGAEVQARPAISSLGETFTAVLYGGEGTISNYLVSALIYVGFAYVVLDGFMVARAGWIPLQLLRHGSPLRWFYAWFGRHLLASLSVSGALVGLLVCTYIAEGGQRFTVEPSAGYQVFVNGTIQLVLYVLAVFLAVTISGSRVSGLVVVAAALVLRPPGAQFGPWLPVQAAALSLAPQALSVTAGLVGACVACLVAILILVRRRPALER